MITAILLAAGSSKRFGKKNKLIASYKKKPLISYVIEHLKKSEVDKIIIVLGNEKLKLIKKIKKEPKIKFVYNKNYKIGMSSSIKFGLKKLDKNTKAFLICLSDMPKISFITYNKIIQKYKKNKKFPAVPFYKTLNGNPVCFPIKYKKKLMSLQGDQGAKYILRKSKFIKVSINSKSILFDMDYKSDFKK
ncbi:MAG: nucleotidyltransferase family protein [Pelagibacteraceae bacterium]